MKRLMTVATVAAAMAVLVSVPAMAGDIKVGSVAGQGDAMSTPISTQEARDRHKSLENVLDAARALIKRLDELSARPNARIDTGLFCDVEVGLKQAIKECE